MERIITAILNALLVIVKEIFKDEHKDGKHIEEQN